MSRLKAAICEQLALPTFERWRAELAQEKPGGDSG
jgi:hypothetical protein